MRRDMIARKDFTQQRAQKPGFGRFWMTTYLRGAFLWVLIVTFRRAAAGTPKCGAAQPRATYPTYKDAPNPQIRPRKPIPVQIMLAVSGLFALLILIAVLAPETPQKNTAPSSEQTDQPRAIAELQRDNEQLEQNQPSEAAAPEASTPLESEQIDPAITTPQQAGDATETLRAAALLPRPQD